MKRARWISISAWLALVALQVVSAGHARAAPGALDSRFGIGGKVTRDFFGNRDEARGIVLQANGKIVVAGFARRGNEQGPDSLLEDFAVERYNADGTLDGSFGTHGDTFTDFGGEDRANGVVMQSNGKIVAAGGTCTGAAFDICDFALARYNPDGTPDPTFGTLGKVTTHFPGFVTIAFGLAIQPEDGKILVSGFAFSGASFDFAVARYNPDGTLDNGFGPGGMVTTDFGVGDDLAHTVAIQPEDGKILVSGFAFSGASFDFAIARYNPDGTLDAGFGVGGKALTDFGSDDEILDLALGPDGNIVALGDTGNGPVAFALARYKADGTLDASFGSKGLVTTDFGSGNAQGQAVAIQPNGQVLAAGGGVFGPDTDFQLARYNGNGTLDPSFGEGGTLTTDFFGGRDAARAMALQRDGKIVLAGFAVKGVSRDFALARYLPR